jgi:hypothetical protein
MSSVVISGDTSGTVTLQAPAVSGSTVLTLPATSGTVLTTTSGTAATATNLSGGSAGTVPYQTASGTTAMLSAGTSGQVLKSNGAAAPSWITPSAGAFSFVSSTTATAASAALLNTGFTSTYDIYELVVFGVTSINNAAIKLRYEIGGSVVTTYTYQYAKGEAQEGFSASGNFTYAGTTAPDNAISLCNVGNAASNSFNLTFRIYRPSSTTIVKQIAWSGSTYRAQTTFLHGNGINTGTGALTGLELTPDSGTITCTMRLYGVANS